MPTEIGIWLKDDSNTCARACVCTNFCRPHIHSTAVRFGRSIAYSLLRLHFVCLFTGFCLFVSSILYEKFLPQKVKRCVILVLDTSTMYFVQYIFMCTIWWILLIAPCVCVCVLFFISRHPQTQIFSAPFFWSGERTGMELHAEFMCLRVNVCFKPWFIYNQDKQRTVKSNGNND